MMVMASFITAEEREEETGESGASTSKTTISINDAAAAFETVYDFLQQGDIEIDYNESKFLKSLKRRLGLLRIKNQSQTRIDSFFKLNHYIMPKNFRMFGLIFISLAFYYTCVILSIF